MADGETMVKAKFHAMTEGTKEDWQAIGVAGTPFNRALPDRLLRALRELGDDVGGFAVNRLEHSLQTATRAHRDGRDEEYVICALIHDIGDILGPSNHAEIGAVILKPYVSERNHFMMDKHGIFQGYYFFHHLGMDRDQREQFRGHPYFERTARFCALYDGPAFDINAPNLPLAFFKPMVERVLAKPRRTIYTALEAEAATR